MANTLTGLIPTIYAGMDVVSRELIGFIPNVMRDASAQMAAVNQTVRSPVVPAITTENITPGATPADSGDQTMGYVDVTITKSKAAPIRWTGEEQLSLRKDGVISTVMRDQFAQAFRAICNEVETDLAALYATASRAYGTAGTTPFGTAADMTDFAGANRILDENGAPQTGRKMILGHAARANLEGKQSQLFKANEAGTDGLLRNRVMLNLHGFDIGFSNGIGIHTKGTGASYQVNNGAGYAINDTAITVDTGSGTIVAGDILTATGDTNKYVVASALASNVVTLASPGLRQTLADNVALTVGNNYTYNMFFHSSSLLLLARQPAMPEGGDDADDVTTITDPISGLTFQVALYKQYRRKKIEIGLAWGVKNVTPRHSGILLG